MLEQIDREREFQAQAQKEQVVAVLFEVVPRDVLSFSKSAPVGQSSTQVPQKVHSDTSRGPSVSVAGLASKPLSR